MPKDVKSQAVREHGAAKTKRSAPASATGTGSAGVKMVKSGTLAHASGHQTTIDPHLAEGRAIRIRNAVAALLIECNVADSIVASPALHDLFEEIEPNLSNLIPSLR